MELIPCGGGDRIAAEREQWNDGSNTLCIAPGTIVVYERNDVTNEVLEEKGLKLVVMPSAELSRGRGGPRCMSMPHLARGLTAPGSGAPGRNPLSFQQRGGPVQVPLEG